jgi:glucose-6-phosphate 1-dehydrogenase
VPFYLRTGKRLPERVTEIVVQFRQVPHSIFSRARTKANRLLIGIQPEGEHHAVADGQGSRARPGRHRLREVPLDIRDPNAFSGKVRHIAYERLLLDLLEGDQTLFVRRDEVEAQWAWIDAIREQWQPKG